MCEVFRQLCLQAVRCVFAVVKNTQFSLSSVNLLITTHHASINQTWTSAWTTTATATAKEHVPTRWVAEYAATVHPGTKNLAIPAA